MTARSELVLREWGTAAPATHPVLRGRTLDEPGLALAERYRHADALRITEGRDGLEVAARQHVGVVQLGDLRIRIRPKVPTTTLWRLVAYGLGVDDLARHPPVDLALDGTFADLLVGLLVAEADRLWARGLARGYVQRREWLTAVRGRPDLATLARHLPLTRAALPCTHHAFTADTLDNRVVLGGLLLARRLVESTRLRAQLHRVAETWRGACAPLAVDRATLDAADRGRTRLTAHYAPVHAVVRALADRSGLDDALASGGLPLAGALWNMATLFERVVARFLTESLPGLQVDAQPTLRRLYSVHGRSTPTPRPDLVVLRHRQPIGVYDTKYRDLSATPLPRDILYQLSVYSLAFGGDRPIPAVVLYAVPSGSRRDVTYTLHVSGGRDRHIVLRAVPLDRLAAAIEGRADPRALAQSLVA